jgi:hypothetical protein
MGAESCRMACINGPSLSTSLIYVKFNISIEGGGLLQSGKGHQWCEKERERRQAPYTEV